MKKFFIAILVITSICLTAGCSKDTVSRRRPRPQDPEESVATAAPSPTTPVAPATAAATPGTAPRGQVAAPAGQAPTQTAPVPTVAAPQAQSPAAAPANTHTVLKPNVKNADEEKAGTEESKRERTIRRLRKIHAALESYRSRKESYPEPSIELRLSWRVRILPDLGYSELYAKFRLGESWDSPHNRTLAAQIPDVFRSPYCEEQKTNLLLMRGAGTAFPNDESTDIRDMIDRPEHTLLLAEVDPKHAVVWTQPVDYPVAREQLQQDFFGLHRDGCFGIFGGATGVRFIPANISDDALSAILTPAGNEQIEAAQVARVATAEIDQSLIELLDRQPISRKLGRSEVAQADASDHESNDSQRADESRPPHANGSKNDRDRWEVPSLASMRQVEASLNEIYGDPSEVAKKKKEERRELAKKLLAESDRFRNEPTEVYVVLLRAKDVAAESGDVVTCVDAFEKLSQYFAIKDHKLRMKALETAARNLGDNRGGLDPLREAAMTVGANAIEIDDFATASSAYRLAIAAARRADDQQRVMDVNQAIDRLEAVKKAHRKIVDSASTLLRDPDHAAANAIVGRYLCLVKHNYAQGVPHLLRGSDATLRTLAERERMEPRDAAEQLNLGDAWWEFGERAGKNVEGDGARTRARHWYQQAVSKLPDGLGKVRAETRLKDDEEKSKKDGLRRGIGAGRTAAPKIGVSTD